MWVLTIPSTTVTFLGFFILLTLKFRLCEHNGVKVAQEVGHRGPTTRVTNNKLHRKWRYTCIRQVSQQLHYLISMLRTDKCLKTVKSFIINGPRKIYLNHLLRCKMLMFFQIHNCALCKNFDFNFVWF